MKLPTPESASAESIAAVKFSRSRLQTSLTLIGIALVAGTAIAAGGSSSGTGATAFSDAVDWVSGMLTGSGGKLFSVGTLAIGLGTSIVKQTLMPVAVAAGIALAASLGPGVLDSIFGMGF